MEIPKDYKCRDQIGKFKCVKRTYENKVDCAKYCPKACQQDKCAY